MSIQVLKKQLEAFSATNIDNELRSKGVSQQSEQQKKIKRKKRQLTLAEQIKKDKERSSQQNHTAENLHYLLLSSSRVAAATKKTTKPMNELEKYEKYKDEKLDSYLGSIKRLKGTNPAVKREMKEKARESERKASVDALCDSILSGEMDCDDLGNGIGLKGRSKDGYQYGKSTKGIKKQF